MKTKTTQAQRNIRKFINAQNGRPKRVTTGVDDYGNRFHVVNGKVKHSRSLSENKKAARKLDTKNDMWHTPPSRIEKRHAVSQRRRESKNTDDPKTYNSKKAKYHMVKNLHPLSRSRRASTLHARGIHEGKRKSKDFGE